MTTATTVSKWEFNWLFVQLRSFIGSKKMRWQSREADWSLDPLTIKSLVKLPKDWSIKCVCNGSRDVKRSDLKLISRSQISEREEKGAEFQNNQCKHMRCMDAPAPAHDQVCTTSSTIVVLHQLCRSNKTVTRRESIIFFGFLPPPPPPLQMHAKSTVKCHPVSFERWSPLLVAGVYFLDNVTFSSGIN